MQSIYTLVHDKNFMCVKISSEPQIIYRITDFCNITLNTMIPLISSWLFYFRELRFDAMFTHENIN